MDFIFTALGFALFVALAYFGIGTLVRWCASREIIWYFIPENTYAFVVGKDNTSTDINQGGGGVIKIGHQIANHRLVQATKDEPAHFETGVESYGLLHRLYNVHYKGPFTAIRRNIIKSTKYGRPALETTKKEGKTVDVDKSDYVIYAEDLETKYVFFSAQQAVDVRSAETSGTYALDFKFNVIFERTYPLTAVIRVADAQSVLSEMIEAKVIAETQMHPPEFFLAGDKVAKEKLVNDDIMGISDDTKKQLGISIQKVTLFSVDPDRNERGLRELLELSDRTRREQEARLTSSTIAKDIKKAEAEGDAEAVKIRAEAAKKARMLDNDASADYVDRVLKATASTPNGPQVAFAHAYRDNTAVRVYAPGGNGVSPIIPPELLSDNESKEKKLDKSKK